MSSALAIPARRGSKSAAAAAAICRRRHRSTKPLNHLDLRHVSFPAAKPHPNNDISLLWLLAAGCVQRKSRVLGATCQSMQKRGLRVQLRPEAVATTTEPFDKATVKQQSYSSSTDGSNDNIFHPRHLAKGVDLDALFDYLAQNADRLGSTKVFKTLRAALYNASGYDAERAWRIYKAMEQHSVTHMMSANHYGHLLNILKYGKDKNAIPRMLSVLADIRTAHAEHRLECSPLHYSQVLFTMGRIGDCAGACKIIREMKVQGIETRSSHYTSLALAARNSGNADDGQQAAKIMIAAMEDGMALEGEACAIMVSLLARSAGPAGGMESTIKFLEAMEKMDSKQQQQQMEDTQSTDLLPKCNARNNEHVYTSIISALARRGDVDKAKQVYDEMESNGVRRTLVTHTAMIDAYSRAGHFETATQMLKKLMRNNNSKPTRSHFAMATTILVNAIRKNRWDVAKDIENSWMTKLEQNPKTADDKFRAAMLWVQAVSSLERARAFFEEQYRTNPKYVNRVMVNHLVISSGNRRLRQKVQESFGLHDVVEPGSPIPMRAHHHYVEALFKCRDVPAALSAFMIMRRQGVPDDISLAMLIQGLVANNENDLAWHVFRTLKLHGFEPNLYAYTTILQVYAKERPKSGITRELMDIWPELHSILTGKPIASRSLDTVIYDPSQAYQVFRELTGFKKPNVYSYTALISCFAKTGLARAVEVFSHMCADGIQPTVQTYTALLQGCAIFRNPRVALIVFQHMRDNAIEPNRLTWHYLLKALARGRVDKDKIDEIGSLARKDMARKML